VVDETHPLIASRSRIFHTENEDFQFNWPNVNEYYYYKMASLNTLRLRMNSQFAGDPKVAGPLYDYMRLTMGKHADDSPDAWVALRQYARAPIDSWVDGEQDLTENIRNFERWLVQREVQPDGRTIATQRVNPPPEFAETNGGSFEALRTDRATGNNYIYFGVDDRFINSGPTRVQIKVTYLDNFSGRWHIEYDAADGNAYKQTVHQTNANDGRWKTVTFTLPDAAFLNRQNGQMDFRLYNGGSSDISVRFVRVIKLDPPQPIARSPAPAPAPPTPAPAPPAARATATFLPLVRR
jgi:hypothetical protein